jgi:hypothetical protein
VLLPLSLNSDEPGVNSICICKKLELEMLNMACIRSLEILHSNGEKF